MLPGIAQLSLVFDTVRQAFHEKLYIKGVKKVKFKQIIKPNDTLEISATQDLDDSSVYSFHIKVDEKIACRGTMIAKGQG